jgi:DUF1365 family protein
MLWLCLDVDELPALDRQVIGFGFNRRSIVSIRNTDYAGPGQRSIRAKLTDLLKTHGIESLIARIELITLPRVLGYAFNPVSFFCCFDTDNGLVTIVAEVHNTFGEQHHYVLTRHDSASAGIGGARFVFPKTFYVSPFYRVNGTYALELKSVGDTLTLTVELHQDDRLVLSTGMSGKATPLTKWSLLASSIRLPLAVATVIPRITWQALQLYLRQRITVVPKPPPTHASTIPARRSSIVHSLRESLVQFASRPAAASSPHKTVIPRPEENPV